MARRLRHPTRALEAVDGNGTIIYGAACPLPARVSHLCQCRPIPPVDVQQPGPQYHWLPIAIDGTTRHEAGYVHCTMGLPLVLSLTSWQVGG